MNTNMKSVELIAEVVDNADMCRGCMHLYQTPERRDPKTDTWAWRRCLTPGCKYHGVRIVYSSDWEQRARETIAALARRVARLEASLRLYAAEDERNGWGGTASDALTDEGS